MVVDRGVLPHERDLCGRHAWTVEEQEVQVRVEHVALVEVLQRETAEQVGPGEDHGGARVRHPDSGE